MLVLVHGLPINTQEEPINSLSNDDDGELLETANTVVFRPIFAYRRQQAKRRRFYGAQRRNYNQEYFYPYYY